VSAAWVEVGIGDSVREEVVAVRMRQLGTTLKPVLPCVIIRCGFSRGLGQKPGGTAVAERGAPSQPRAKISEGLPGQEGEPQGAQIPEGPPGLAGKVPWCKYL
jgi:hypothetical protein